MRDVVRAMRAAEEGGGTTCRMEDEADATSWVVATRAAACPPALRKALAVGRAEEVRWHVRFDADFPASPPAVRVLSPAFEHATGHVLDGGAVCAEVLSHGGWAQLRARVADDRRVLASLLDALVHTVDEGAPRVARRRRHYDEEEARRSFARAAERHAWA
jgi:hypothetical protein